MYSEMTSETEIFSDEIALDLVNYRRLLEIYGITTALDNIIKQEKTEYWVISRIARNQLLRKFILKFYFNEKNKLSCDYDFKFEKENESDEDEDEDENDDENNNKNYLLEVASGDFFIDNGKFKYVRCDGCKDNNCVSCLLKKLLRDENLLDKNSNSGLFVDVFLGHSAKTDSDECRLIRSVIYQGLKNNKKNIKFYGIDNNDVLKINVDPGFRKCVMIEWALTIEFLERFIPIFLEKNENFELFRTLKGDIVQIKETEPIDSTSLFAPVFIPKDARGFEDLSFFKIKGKIFRCISNHIISPIGKSIFSGIGFPDVEQEVIYIPIGQDYVRINNLPNKGGGHFSEYKNFLFNVVKKFKDKNLPKHKELIKK